MGFILLLLIVSIGFGLLIKTLIIGAFSSDESHNSEPNIVINNYTTEQHLHITEDQAEKLNK